MLSLRTAVPRLLLDHLGDEPNPGDEIPVEIVLGRILKARSTTKLADAPAGKQRIDLFGFYLVQPLARRSRLARPAAPFSGPFWSAAPLRHNTIRDRCQRLI